MVVIVGFEIWHVDSPCRCRILSKNTENIKFFYSLNANTTGFQADFAQARSMGVYYGDGHSTRAYAMTESPGTNFNHGALIDTGRDLDVAVDTDGWLAVQAQDGREAFTRGGSLRLSPTGQLLTGNNLPVMGDGGPISIPPFDKLTLGADGTITIQPEGQAAGVLAIVDRIKLVRPNYEDLQKGLDGLVSRKDGQEEQPDPRVRVQSGFLEGSNVDTVDELTQIMAMARQYEINIKLMKTVDENSQAATSLLKSS
ncbi:flagellar basal body rod protein FlgF [Dasania marina]|uniref:flagellar basal body rod protein FlgF n=1 Tax=Dasania marina TaxID=471499 RepID=UPI001969FA06|nr:flagellar basal body rod protein FlgF [Dasania marina]